MSEPKDQCPNCADLLRRLEIMERKVSWTMAKMTKAEKRVQELQELLAGSKKNSSTSSKPPSSDIVKPPKKKKEGQRRRGGQEGHPPQQRPPFSPDQIDAVERHAYEACPQCGGPVEQHPTPARTFEQAELVHKPVRVTQHQSLTCRCVRCQQDFTQPIPAQVAKAGTFGPRLTAYVAYLKGACHASYGTLQKLLKETCGLKIATGTLVELCQKVAESLLPAYGELLDQLPHQPSVHIDETGHRENGQRHWTWVFRAPQFTLFQIRPSRGAEVLDHNLGEDFSGTLLSDYYSAYRAYLSTHPKADAQFCLAHLIRDVKFLETLPDQVDRKFGAEMVAELKALFGFWHTLGTTPGDAALRAALVAQGARLQSVATEHAPDTQASQAIAKRFLKHGAEYLRFTKVPGLEPTNNTAEQAIRQIVIDRRVTQGTRSWRGQVWCERIWTTIATCRQHGRDLLTFLEESLRARLTNTPPPLLLPAQFQ
jgi:transposase